MRISIQVQTGNSQNMSGFGLPKAAPPLETIAVDSAKLEHGCRGFQELQTLLMIGGVRRRTSSNFLARTVLVGGVFSRNSKA